MLLPAAALGVFILIAAQRADKVANDVIEKSPPGDGCALWGALITVAIPGVIVLGGLLLMAGILD